MKTVSVQRFVEGVNSIYVEQPGYQLGHDGSDGTCDCIGMPRGGLERAGATDVKNMRGTNQAARKAIENLSELKLESQLSVGDVVLKVRDKDDPSMPLPDQYRKGGSDYDPEVGETNFTHIGTVTKIFPLEITHMTSPKPKKDSSIKGWSWFGQLPWVEYIPFDEDIIPDIDTATVFSENGKPVKMRQKPSTSCRVYDEVPCGAVVNVIDWDCATDKSGNAWSSIAYGNRVGWFMMSRFLYSELFVTVTIPGLTKEQADELLRQYPDGYITAG